jgi:hypothetical protein
MTRIIHQSALPLILAYTKYTPFQRQSGSPTSAEAASFLQATTVPYDQRKAPVPAGCFAFSPFLVRPLKICFVRGFPQLQPHKAIVS